MPKVYPQQRAEELGLPIRDADRDLAIVVTDNDVVMAKKANSKQCALARAAKRIAGVRFGYFFLSTAYLEFGDRMVRYRLPPSVQKEIVSFDRAQTFASGTYVLLPPVPNQNRALQQRKRKERRAGRPDGRRRPRFKTPAPALRGPEKSTSLSEKIQRVVDREPKFDSPEQREFDRKIALITSTQPKPQPKRTHHRTKFVRSTAIPEAE